MWAWGFLSLAVDPRSRAQPAPSTRQALKRALPNWPLRVLAASNGIMPFGEKMRTVGFDPLSATGITVFQINVGKFCNQTCHHCHVDAGPDRREVMTHETAELCLVALAQTDNPNADFSPALPEGRGFNPAVTSRRRSS